jgi:hypothetical protein
MVRAHPRGAQRYQTDVLTPSMPMLQNIYFHISILEPEFLMWEVDRVI